MQYNDIFQNAKEELNRRRSAARDEADRRDMQVRAESPEIAEIDTQLRKTTMMIFKAACSGEDVNPIKERNRELQKKREEILVSLGYPADYTKIKYTCPECADTGYKGTKYCSCLKELIIKGRIAASAMGNLIERQSFDNFSLEPYAYDQKVYERMKTILAVAKAYVRDFDKSADNLLLIGKTGTGKTHISTAIARELIHKGYDVVYDSTQNVISDFEADRFKSGYGQYDMKSEKYLNCRLLIIDDLGTEFINAFTVSTLYNLINTRQNKGLPTIISTNLSPEELARKYEDRIYSRIIGAGTRVLPFEGRDLRVTR